MVKQIKKVMMLCIMQLSLLGISIHAQEHGGLGNRKVFYGLHLGFTENRVKIGYCDADGVVHALQQGNSSFCASGFDVAVMYELRMGHLFSLRTMPGIALLNAKWDPDGVSVIPLSFDYKVESVLGELPIEVKFHPFSWGDIEPYLVSGLKYSFDFVSLRNGSDGGCVRRVNAHDLSYTCGLGLDWYTRYLRLGVELKAAFSHLPSDDGSTGHPNTIYFHSTPTFTIGLNIEA